MLTRRSRITAVMIGLSAAVLALSSCASGASDTDTPEKSTAEQSTAEQVIAGDPGPYQVGRRTIEMPDPEQPDRVLPVDIWYPVDQTTTGDPTNYEFLPGLGYTADGTLAEAPVADGSFPLLIYSHGSGGFRWIATFFTEFMASKGYVVAAPDHLGNTALDQLTEQAAQRAEIAVNRPQDVTATIDAMLAASSDAADPLAGRIDGDKIAVSGHSFGGFTSLAAVSGFENAAGAAAADDRISAVILMAAWTELLSDENLANIDVPTLMISSTGDERTPIDPNTTRPDELIPGRPLVRVDITGGGHNSFTDVCKLDERVGSAPNIPQAIKDELSEGAEPTCGPGVLSVDTIHDITNSYSAAFLADSLGGSREFEAMLDCVAPPQDAICTVQQ
jgi:predicted dienelactone hydrolase